MIAVYNSNLESIKEAPKYEGLKLETVITTDNSNSKGFAKVLADMLEVDKLVTIEDTERVTHYIYSVA